MGSKKREAQSVEEKSFYLEQFIGLLGHETAQTMGQNAHMYAGPDIRRSEPELYNQRYYEALQQQLREQQLDKNPDFWRKVQDKFDQKQDVSGFNLQLREARKVFGLQPGELTDMLKEGRGADIKRSIPSEAPERTNSIPSDKDLLHMDAVSLRRMAGGFTKDQQKDFWNAKDNLDSLINFVCPGGEEPGPIDGKMQGEAIRNGEKWIPKSKSHDQDDSVTMQYRVPGTFASLRDQLSPVDPKSPFWKEFRKQYERYDRAGKSEAFLQEVSPALEVLGLEAKDLHLGLEKEVQRRTAETEREDYKAPRTEPDHSEQKLPNGAEKEVARGTYLWRLSDTISAEARSGPTALSRDTFPAAVQPIVAPSVGPAPDIQIKNTLLVQC
jgi:hypothetical protein